MRLQQPFLKLARRYCAQTLAAEVASLPREAWLPHPGRIPGNDAVPLVTPGGQVTNGFAGAMAPTEHLRRCPYIMEIMADLGAVWGRSRLMGLAPSADVPEHVDVGYYWRTHTRVHIPIITSPQVAFTCDGETVHMAAGECWMFDSFRMHKVRNGGTAKRIHLVLDTVGGERLWALAEAARTGAEAQVVRPGEATSRAIAYEKHNIPELMSAWEIRCHVDFLLGQVPASTSGSRDAVALRLDALVNAWSAAWAQFGAGQEGLSTYRRLLQDVQSDLRALRADTLLLINGVPLLRALSEIVFQVAVPAQQPKAALAAVR